MFKKLVSNLPFNPSLLNELSFYAKRLHQEETIRRSGFVIMALAIFVQAFSLISPPQATLAGSNSNVVYGANDKGDIQSAHRNNRDANGRSDIQAIYSYYGITLADIDRATGTTVNTANEKRLITTGRSISSNQPQLNSPVSIAGLETELYERPLTVWDIKGTNNYKAITGTATGNGLLKGQTFWILLGYGGGTSGCGNITFMPVPKTPDLDIKKEKVTQGNLEAGDTLEYKLIAQNRGTGTANNVVVTDTLPNEVEFVSQSNTHPAYSTFSRNGQTLTWNIPSFLATQYSWKFNIKTKVKAINTTKTICNTAVIKASNNGSVQANDPESERCAKVEVPVCEDGDATNTGGPLPCTYPNPVCEDSGAVNTGDALPCTYPDPVCEDDSAVNTDETGDCRYPGRLVCEDLNPTKKLAYNRREFETEIGYLEGSAQLTAVEYYVNSTLVQTNETATDALTDTYVHEFNTVGEYTIEARLVPGKDSIIQASSSCTYTDSIVTPEVFEPLTVRDKRVAFTANGEDANTKNVAAGEELSFTLTIANEGNATAEKQRFVDDVSDILEYADITDNGGANYDGVAQTLTWEPVDVLAGASESRTFKVRIKSPIPSTPVEVSDPESYDNKIVNTFGNSVSINVPRTVTKQVEVVVNTLPNTGPGLTMALSSLVFATVGYFFFRARLLGKEVEIIKTEQAAGGI